MSKDDRRALYASSHEVFRKIAQRTADGVGHPWAFSVALLVVVAWALSGPVFGFSDTWQLVINTGTTIVTFLTVFLVQNTQNRDFHAIHLKLDELIRVNTKARNALLLAEDLTEKELDELQSEYERLAHEKIAERKSDGQRTSSRKTAPSSSRTSPAST